MYMPGRLRTASRPSRIWIEEAPYSSFFGLVLLLVLLEWRTAFFYIGLKSAVMLLGWLRCASA
jgi:hypothetical protein